MNDSAIGIFDSGMGGLTVMRELATCLPDEDFIYLGDTARLPYGTKSPETVSRYALQAASTLVARGMKLLVIACNTASAYALDSLRETLAPLPVIGVIEPGAEAAIAAAPDGPIAVIATEGTVKGGAYLRAIWRRAQDMEVMQQACPLFVPLAEEGLMHGDIAEATARHYLEPLRNRAPKCLVLGCTHFPVLKDIIARAIGPDVVLVDSAATTAGVVARQLIELNLRRGRNGGSRRYLVTDAPERFMRVGALFLGSAMDPASIELIDLTNPH